jgi:hypothetical protein
MPRIKALYDDDWQRDDDGGKQPIIGSASEGRSENIFATFFDNQRY